MCWKTKRTRWPWEYYRCTQYLIHVSFKNFRKNEKNATEILSSESNSLIKDGELWRSKSYNNKKSTKQVKICNKKWEWNSVTNNKKHFQDEELPHELFLGTRPKTKTRTDLINNM